MTTTDALRLRQVLDFYNAVGERVIKIDESTFDTMAARISTEGGIIVATDTHIDIVKPYGRFRLRTSQ